MFLKKREFIANRFKYQLFDTLTRVDCYTSPMYIPLYKHLLYQTTFRLGPFGIAPLQLHHNHTSAETMALVVYAYRTYFSPLSRECSDNTMLLRC